MLDGHIAAHSGYDVCIALVGRDALLLEIIRATIAIDVLGFGGISGRAYHAGEGKCSGDDEYKLTRPCRRHDLHVGGGQRVVA